MYMYIASAKYTTVYQYYTKQYIKILSACLLILRRSISDHYLRCTLGCLTFPLKIISYVTISLKQQFCLSTSPRNNTFAKWPFRLMVRLSNKCFRSDISPKIYLIIKLFLLLIDTILDHYQIFVMGVLDRKSLKNVNL